MKKVEMPKMGDTMEEGKILHWLKKEGEQVKKGEMLAEVETDKVNIEIEAFASGTMSRILVAEGCSAPIGAPIALIGTPDEPLPDSPGSGGKSAETTKTAGVPTAANVQGSATQQPVASAVFASAQQANSADAAPGSQGRVFISPIARRIAEENKLDYAGLRGTGPNGRIIKPDV